MKRIFLFTILALIVTGFYFFNQNVQAQSNVSPIVINESERQQILAATVQIQMKAPLIDEAGSPVLTERDGNWYTVDAMAHGLGTVTKIDNQLFIVTHDHWGALLDTAVTVIFQNAQGQPLLELPGDTFRSLIVYQDQGTMLLQAPVAITPLIGNVAAANSQSLSLNNQVLLARHQAGYAEVEVVAAQVTAVTDRNGVPAYQLQQLDGSPVVEGDSGGGLWFEGQLVGNLWRNVAIETVQLANGESFDSTQQITANSIATAYPNLTTLIQPEGSSESAQMPQRLEPVSP
jgi:hypothetical protein